MVQITLNTLYDAHNSSEPVLRFKKITYFHVIMLILYRLLVLTTFDLHLLDLFLKTRSAHGALPLFIEPLYNTLRVKLVLACTLKDFNLFLVGEI